MFAEFLEDPEVKLIGVEAAGLGIETGKHASAMALGKPGTLHGMLSYLLQDENGNVQLAHSISAGLDYPGVGPEHAYLKRYEKSGICVCDRSGGDGCADGAVQAGGIIPAIESAHALAHVCKVSKNMSKDESIIVCLSGRGDKDVHTISDYLEGKDYLY